MRYRNPPHGPDSEGDSDHGESGDTLPRMTADTPDDEPRDEANSRMVPTALGPLFITEATDATDTRGWVTMGEAPPPDADLPEVGAVLEIDMAYLHQRALERMAERGEALPAGVTVESLAEWRDAHPSYDPSLPLAGMPLPDGFDESGVTVGGGPLHMREADGHDANTDLAFPDEVVDPDEVDSVSGVGSAFVFSDGQMVNLRRALTGSEIVTTGGPATSIVESGVAEPDARCLAATGASVDEGRRCPVHRDGSHHCYQGPGHQGAKAPAPVVMAPCAHVVPEWATHSCDCGFAWTNVVQVSP